MPFDKALRFASLLLAGASFLGLALGSALPDWLVGVGGAALALQLLHTAGVFSLGRMAARLSVSAITWNLLLVFGFFGFWADMLWISGELLPAGIHFLVILMVIKIFTLHRRRDYLHLYAISLMAILASAASTTDFWYLPMFLVYLVSGVWTLLLFQLAKTSEATVSLSAADSPPLQHRISPELFRLANGLVAGVLGFTVLIFFAIPRVSAGLFQNGAGESIRTSGFSDRVNLGAIGPIKRDPSIVMRVELPDPSARQMDRLYLRGLAYDLYDGTSWTNQFTHRRELLETAPMTFTVRAPRSQGLTLRQNILLESLDTTVLFAAPLAETVTGRFMTVQSDAAGGLYLPFPSSTRMEYSVVSRTAPLLAADRQPQSAAYSESFLRHYLQTPPDSERVAALALDITRDQQTRYDKAAAIERYLSQNFRYSLDIPVTKDGRPLDEFLFTRKTGYCEHYATAMVIMLRMVGIPARLVTGFLATEWNEYGNYYLVRQQDAHAWVEVHLPQSGWINMDPTPAVLEGAVPSGWQTLGRVIDHVRLRWNRFFVQYSAADQMAVVREVKAGSVLASTKAWDSMRNVFYPLAARIEKAVRQAGEGNLRLFAVLVGLVLMLTAVIAWWAGRPAWRKERLKASPRQPHAIVQVYKTMLEQLSVRGLSKPDGTTPLEFLSIIRERRKAAEPAAATITVLYCRARFGQTPPTEDELRLAKASLRQLMALEQT
jgi:protein-glutamine gamma-glutamyltransferase